MLAKRITFKRKIHFWILAILFAANISMGWLSYHYYIHKLSHLSEQNSKKDYFSAGVQIINGGISISEYLKNFSDRR